MVQLAVSIGLGILTNVLFPPKDVNVEGPRLSDLSVSSSAYGEVIPVASATIRLSGNMIWSTGLDETTNKQSAGGKGLGGPKTTQTTFTYSSSYAMAFCVGEAKDITRIWANGKLIFDKQGTDDVDNGSFKFRFYNGSETQLVDSLIFADKGSLANANRGIVYIVFEDMQLADFGNGIPNINAEITFNDSQIYPKIAGDPLTEAEGGIFATTGISTINFSSWGVNFNTRRMFMWQRVNNDSGGLRVLNIDTMSEVQQRLGSEISPALYPNGLNASVMYADNQTNALYVVDNSTGANSRTILRIDQNSLQQTASFGFSSNSTETGQTTFSAIGRMCMIRPIGLQGVEPYLLCGELPTLNSGFLGLLTGESLFFVWGSNQGGDTPGRITGVSSGLSGPGVGEGWVLNGDRSGVITLNKVTVGLSASFSPLPLPDGATFGVSMESFDILHEDLGFPSGTGSVDTYGPLYDPSDNSVIMIVSDETSTQNSVIFKWNENIGIVWQTIIPNTESTSSIVLKSYSEDWTESDISRGVVGVAATGSNDSHFKFNTATGQQVYRSFNIDSGFPDIGGGFGESFIYDSRTDSIITLQNAFAFRYFLDRGTGGGVTLRSVLEQLSAKGGLDVSTEVEFIGFDDNIDIVRGYVVGRSSSIADAISQLSQAYFFEVVESDYKMKFIKKNTTSIVNIEQKDLGRLDEAEGSYLKESRIQEVELPERVKVLYLDRDADYQQGSQHFKRIANPGPTMFSREQKSIELPIVLNADEAKQIAEKNMFGLWIERTTFDATLPWKFVEYDPTDVVTLNLDNNDSYKVRIDTLNMGSDFTLEFRAKLTADDIFTSTAVANTGGFESQDVGGGSAAPLSKLFLLDTPLLRGTDDLSGIGSRVYFAVGSFRSGWKSATVFTSVNGNNFDELGAVASEVTWGTSSDVLLPPQNVFATDTINEIIVFLQTEGPTLSSITNLELLAGGNPLLVGNEILQFKTATLNADSSYTLTDLLRGRRGTEWAVGDHIAGEDVIILSNDAVFPYSINLEEINSTRFFKAVTTGQLLEDALLTSKTFQGNDLKPYAPVNFSRTDNLGVDIQINWIRRDRINGADLVDSTSEIVNSETLEEYEVYILQDPYDKDTFDVTNDLLFYYKFDSTVSFGTKPLTNTVTWEASDFNGFTQATETLHIVVFQISSVIGRGFPGNTSLFP